MYITIQYHSVTCNMFFVFFYMYHGNSTLVLFLYMYHGNAKAYEYKRKKESAHQTNSKFKVLFSHFFLVDFFFGGLILFHFL